MKDIIILRLNTIIGALRIISQEVNGLNADLFNEDIQNVQQPTPAPEPTPPEEPKPAQEPTKQPVEKKQLFGTRKRDTFPCVSKVCGWSASGFCNHPKALETCDGRVLD